jgi:GTP cyclohydrolase I
MSKKKPHLPGMAKKMSPSRQNGKPVAKPAHNIGPEDEVDGYTRVDVYDAKTIARIGSHYGDILKHIGEDPAREGLQRTPERVAKALQYLTHGYDLDPAAILESALFHENYSQMVVVKDIEMYSLCEHHMLPFFGKAHVAYIPDGRITGLSKIPRVVDAFARRLQVQERLTNQIRDCIHNTLRPLGVAVVIEADHLCMRMRGVQKQNSVTTTSAFTGIFLSDHRSREEFIKLISAKLH